MKKTKLLTKLLENSHHQQNPLGTNLPLAILLVVFASHWEKKIKKSRKHTALHKLRYFHIAQTEHN